MVATLARAARESSAASRPWLSTAGWIPRASSRSSSSDSESSSPADVSSSSASAGSVRSAALDHAQLERHGHEPRLRPVVEVALEPPALGVAGSDDALARRAQLGEPVLRLRLQPRVVERDRRRGRDGRHELRIVVERCVVDEHRELAAVALDGRGRPVATGRGQLDRLAAAVDVGIARPAPGTPARGRDRRAPWRAPPPAARRAACRARGRDPRARRARAASAAGPRATPPGP